MSRDRRHLDIAVAWLQRDWNSLATASHLTTTDAERLAREAFNVIGCAMESRARVSDGS